MPLFNILGLLLLEWVKKGLKREKEIDFIM